jgi:DNA topoisomerase-1
VEYFPNVVNTDFTASMESQLDGVEEDKVVWPEMIRNFYTPFKERVDEVGKTLESYKGTLDEKTDYVCEKCGKPMVKKLGRYGFFLACSGFPECRNTKSIPLAKCPKCGGDIVARKTTGKNGKGRGKEFYGCTNYPKCDFISHFKPLQGQNCPKCGWFLVEKYDKKNGSHKACIHPDCDYLHDEEDLTANHVHSENVNHANEEKEAAE